MASLNETILWREMGEGEVRILEQKRVIKRLERNKQRDNEDDKEDIQLETDHLRALEKKKQKEDEERLGATVQHNATALAALLPSEDDPLDDRNHQDPVLDE
ncbi:hypothetical protein ACHAWF_001006 [Thalassiosira exigua]